MIRFSALLVAVATVLLIAGVVTSKLALVYVAIGVSALALVALGAGAGLKRHELFGQAAGSDQARQPVPSASSASPQPAAVSVAANGSTGAGGSNAAGASNVAPWESGAAGWGNEAAAWGSEAHIRERDSARKPDPFPESSAWPPAPATPAASGWPAPPEAGRFETGHPVPGLAAYSPPMRTPGHARPADREVPAEEPAPSAAYWSPTITPPAAPSDADDVGFTTATPVSSDPGLGDTMQDVADAKADAPGSVDAEKTVKLGDDRPGGKHTDHPDEDVTRQDAIDIAEPGVPDVEAGDDSSHTETSGHVSDDASADVTDDAEAKTVGAARSTTDTPDAGDHADSTMAIDPSTMVTGPADTGTDTGTADASSDKEPGDTDSAKPANPDPGASAESGPLTSAGNGLVASVGYGPAASADSSPNASVGNADNASASDSAAAADGGAEFATPLAPDPSLEVTIVPGVPRYHDARCILIRFMGEDDLEKVTLGAAKEVGCTPCRACLPEHDLT